MGRRGRISWGDRPVIRVKNKTTNGDDNNKKLRYRREIAHQLRCLRTSFSARSMIVHFTERPTLLYNYAKWPHISILTDDDAQCE